ncbi:glutamyl-tRNA amidotransferase [Slackia equolifaciens]|uniref:Glutamyl-tRNA amidotransferase n=1 Tax=Slackia equolifaciens TaxID=498718 RepID=A0A3N0AVD7_9ACTN|nr:GatB/YqeY domain-containing protein [Slackia equolifaciens]RNL38821.1 glutamyl-tRNA amidotransferase [Slackia equolifaciens]
MKYEELKEEIKNAMKAHDKVRLSILRQVHGEIKNIEVNERREITDADVDAMLKRLIKQTSETLEGSIKAGNNEERTETLRAQVAILEEYLPRQISGDELIALVEKTIAEVGAATKRDMGKVMGALNAATGGNFDKAAAAKEVGSRLA